MNFVQMLSVLTQTDASIQTSKATPTEAAAADKNIPIDPKRFQNLLKYAILFPAFYTYLEEAYLLWQYWAFSLDLFSFIMFCRCSESDTRQLVFEQAHQTLAVNSAASRWLKETF